MPMRQHVELLSAIPFFRLDEAEQQALKDFNRLFEHKIQQLITNTQTTMTRLNLLFQPNHDPQNNAKIRANILQQDLSDLTFELPANMQALCEKSPYSLIRLAFHIDGEMF